MTGRPLFPLGQVVATPGALAYTQAGVDFAVLLGRHVSGDWGDLDEHDKGVNVNALKSRNRIMSSYTTPAGVLWIITEADRSSTCLLLPEEY